MVVVPPAAAAQVVGPVLWQEILRGAPRCQKSVAKFKNHIFRLFCVTSYSSDRVTEQLIDYIFR